jgi:hypothetical protein
MNWTSLKQGKKSQLTPYRLQLLNQVGLDFRPTGRDAVKFETRLKQLEDYRSEHGHCNVPQFYKPVPGLGEWVLYIRRKYYDQQLPAERVTALENIGFQWRLRAPRGSKQYEQQAAAGPSIDHDTHRLW